MTPRYQSLILYHFCEETCCFLSILNIFSWAICMAHSIAFMSVQKHDIKETVPGCQKQHPHHFLISYLDLFFFLTLTSSKSYKFVYSFIFYVSFHWNVSFMRTGVLVSFVHCWVFIYLAHSRWSIIVEGLWPQPASTFSSLHFILQTGNLSQFTMPQSCLLLKSLLSLKIYLRYHLCYKNLFQAVAHWT